MATNKSILRRFPHVDTSTAEHSNDTSERNAVSTTRLNLKLPNAVFSELQTMSLESGRTMTEIVRIGLALAALAADEEKAGRKLAVVGTDGNVVKEIVFAK